MESEGALETTTVGLPNDVDDTASTVKMPT